MAARIRTLRRFTNVMALIDTLLHKRLVLTNPRYWTDANDQVGIEVFREKLRLTSVRALCFTEAGETFHHWQVFAGGNAGVSILFKRQRLIETFNANMNLLHGPVEYLTISALRAIADVDVNRLPFMKRHGFADEKEYRVIVQVILSDPEAIPIPIDLAMIEEVVFSPFAISDLVTSVAQVCAALPDCGHIRFRQSDLTNNKDWQGAVNEYAERDQTVYGEWLSLRPEEIRALLETKANETAPATAKK